MLNPDHIAETYLALHRQHRTAWTHELDLADLDAIRRAMGFRSCAIRPDNRKLPSQWRLGLGTAL